MGPVTEKRESFTAIVGRSAFLLALASVAFTIPGIVRTKLSALFFGEQGIALFGQLSQMQTLLISIGAAGLVTATRVVLSRPQQSPERTARLQSWCLWFPFAGSLVLGCVLAVLAPLLSSALLGSAHFASEVVFAALGIPFAVSGQIAIAGAQARGSRLMLVAAAGGSAMIGSFVVWMCMNTRDQGIGSISFIAAPAIQLFFVVLVCAPVRKAIFSLPWISRSLAKEVIVIAWASAVLAICASLADLFSRSLIVHFHGLSSLASYQPVATLVTQLVSIGLSALATASLVELSQVRDRLQIADMVVDLERRYIPLIGIFCALLLSASPLLVRIFFTAALWHSAYPIMAVAVAFETVRAAVWIAGSAFLPNGMRMAWLFNGLLTVITQVSFVLALSFFMGPISLSIGFAFANIVSLVVTVLLLKRAGIRVGMATTVRPFAIAAVVLLSSLWSVTILGLVVTGPLLCAVIIAVVVVAQRFTTLRNGREMCE